MMELDGTHDSGAIYKCPVKSQKSEVNAFIESILFPLPSMTVFTGTSKGWRRDLWLANRQNIPRKFTDLHSGVPYTPQIQLLLTS